MSSSSQGSGFSESLQEYLDTTRRANSEAALGHHFLNFIQGTFDTLNSGEADDLLPFLEEYVATNEAAVAIRGRIDARLGNVLIEFKTSLEKFQNDAESQLREYITAIWTEQGQDQEYYLVASDGLDCIVYTAELEDGETLSPDNVELNPVDEIHLAEDDAESVYRKLDQYLLFSDNIAPTAENFVSDFGPGTPLYREGLELLKEEWDDVREDGAEVLFDEWRRYLEIVHGEQEHHSEELFLRHTYLSVLAKLMAYVQYSGGTLPDGEVHEVITGEVFSRWGIRNFIEEDFFAWISRPEADSADTRVAQHLLSRLRDYNLTTIEEDVLKELYQNLVGQQERHSLGEYYTPDWLVQEVVEDQLEDEPDASVLDPTCGSGTFLFKSIQYKRENLDKEGQELLNHIFKDVVGVDIHPLAVITARVNYLLAVGDILRDHRSGSVSIPVYLSNSIQPPSYEKRMEGVKVYRFESDEDDGVFEIPVTVADDLDILNDVLDGSKAYLDANDSINQESLNAFLSRRIGDDYDELSDEERNVIWESIVKRIRDLQEEDRDTIWTFILKNVYKPIYLEHRRFDRILGNPPWLSYRYITREDYESHVRDLTIDEYGLLDSGEVENMTHMELAALFFAYSIDHYLKDDGYISFVMPRGIFNSDHLANLREFEFGDGSAHPTTLWDLEGVSPLFNVPSCVIAAQKAEGERSPVEGRTYNGTLPEANVDVDVSRERLEMEETTFYLNILGERSVVMTRELDPEVFRAESPYESQIRQGATIVPRSLWFVEFEEHPTFSPDPTAPLVQTSQRAKDRAKEPWDNVEMSQQIESQFIFHTVTGSELIHFHHLNFPLSVLPVEIENDSYHLYTEEEARTSGFQHLPEWIANAEEQWDDYKEETTDEDVLEWLNYRHKLTQQDPDARYRVLQNTSGSYVYGAVVDTADLDDPTTQETEIDLQRNNEGNLPLVVDHKCYSYGTDNVDEAYYLCGFLNAPLILELIEEMMSRGLFGGRDVHKRVWEVAIPEYNPEDETHTAIRDAAMRGEAKAEELLPELLDQYNPLTALSWIRRRQREKMEPIRSELSELCIEALEESQPTQTTLTDMGDSE
ncbi:N-6 DNA methylase [Candidatus Halobonum tyrrellensis]|uniref:site-specific DNA-methyltransferase (adenine-specific) n=1 Tax=Candidatus Halobonum tyrrellensis G22 TaxID=1324957 RepID=V4J0F2_9EURY|nr:N-6 DNA methylase [Candidatus Halobonum tyrrellensis]ESP88922.1 BseRI endonuclease, putative [Candidatus Halobonum tyrrellensis G22]